jgi:hypothetical protein
MLLKNNENLVTGGIFGLMIGVVFMSLGRMSNFLCEMLFWLFLLYVAVMYLKIVPNVAKNMIKNHGLMAKSLMSLAWVPLVVGAMIVFFLGSLLFVDYSFVELNKMLLFSKIILFGAMMLSLCVVLIRHSDRFHFVNSF